MNEGKRTHLFESDESGQNTAEKNKAVMSRKTKKPTRVW